MHLPCHSSNKRRTSARRSASSRALAAAALSASASPLASAKSLVDDDADRDDRNGAVPPADGARETEEKARAEEAQEDAATANVRARLRRRLENFMVIAVACSSAGSISGPPELEASSKIEPFVDSEGFDSALLFGSRTHQSRCSRRVLSNQKTSVRLMGSGFQSGVPDVSYRSVRSGFPLPIARLPALGRLALRFAFFSLGRSSRRTTQQTNRRKPKRWLMIGSSDQDASETRDSW